MIRNYPTILILREKHGDRHYLLKNSEQSKRTFLEVLKRRHKEGWYGWMKNYTSSTKAPSFTIGEINNLPDSMLEQRKKMKSELSNYERELKRVESYHNLYNKIEKVIETNDGNQAYLIIDKLRGGEYEGYDIEYPTIIE